jgi:hypothetical protein
MLKLGFLLFIALASGTIVRYERFHYDLSSVRQSFFVAIEPNRDGVESVRRYILGKKFFLSVVRRKTYVFVDHSSNPDSRDYGNFLSTKQIDDMLRPRDMSDTISDLKELGVHCEEYTSTTLKCRATNQALHQTFSDGVPDHLVGRVNFAETSTTAPPITIYLAKHRALSGFGRPRPQVDPSVSPGFISREVMLRTYLAGQSGKVDGSRVSAGAMEFLNNEGFNEDDMMIVQNHSCTTNNPVSRDHILGFNAPNPDGESELGKCCHFTASLKKHVINVFSDMAVIWQAADGVDLWYEDYDGWIFGWAAYMFRRANFPQVAR